MDCKSVSVIISNLNGEEFLPRCISSLLRAFEVYLGDHEIIMVDNASTDNSVRVVHSDFPMVKVKEMSKNFFYGAACREGSMLAKNDILILFNNDAYAQENFLFPLIRHFASNDELFAVGCKILDWDQGTFQSGRVFWEFRRGTIVTFAAGDVYASACPTAFATGAACAIDRRKYLNMGGSGNIHRWSDTELCYRARKRGWEVLYEPDSIVYHKGMATEKRTRTKRETTIEHQLGMFYTIWRNVTDADLLAQHIMFLPYLFATKGVRTTLAGFLEATKLLPQITQERKQEKPFIRRTDKEVLVPCQRDVTRSGC